MKETLEKFKSYLDAVPDPIILISKSIGIIILSMIAVRLGSYVIKKIFEKQKKFRHGLENKKIDTMSTLLVSVFRYTVYTIAGVSILTDLFHLQSVLAAAGIGGVAVGLGAQSLIKDVISGFFIVMEDQFGVGDVITIESMTGTVEEMELRVTRIRNENGDLYIIPNSEIKKVTNHSRCKKSLKE